MAWIGDNVPTYERQKALAKLLTATLGGVIVGQWVGGIAVEHLEWRFAFGVLSILFAIAASLRWRLDSFGHHFTLAEKGGSVGAQAYWPPSALGAAMVLAMLLTTLVEGAAIYGPLAFIPTFLAQAFGLS